MSLFLIPFPSVNRRMLGYLDYQINTIFCSVCCNKMCIDFSLKVILCTKEVSVKARTASLSLLLEACNALFRGTGVSRQGLSFLI